MDTLIANGAAQQILEHGYAIEELRIRPPKTADQLRLRADGLRVHFLARLCTA